MDLKKVKNEKGITLIALSVTIVVLLILAGVTISSVFSENGIIERAKKAQEAINESQKNDLAELEKLAEQMEKYTSSDDTVGVDLSEYATLNLQAYVGKLAKQKCDYMQMYIEISDVNNSADKITYAIGTDWQENVVKENDELSKLYLKNSSNLNMITINEHDAKYDSSKDVTEMSEILAINGLTDISLSNLYIKKGKNYDIKISVLTTKMVNDSVTDIATEMVYLYEKQTGIVENDISIIGEKNECLYWKMLNANGDNRLSADDGNKVSEIISKCTLPKYSLIDYSGEAITVILLIDENGEPINDEAKKYIGFDYNRNGYLSSDDSRCVIDYLSNKY